MNQIDIQADDDTIYQIDLAVTLELESDGNGKIVSSSNIEKFELEFHSYGFDGYVHFSGFDDDHLEKIFNSEKPINVTFTYQTDDEFSEKKNPVEVKGVVYERISRGIEKEKLEIRAYQIRFCDGAQESWSSHFPKALYIDKTMKDVIEKEKNPMINVQCDWDILTEEHPIIAFSLEDDYHISKEKRTSFYSFLHWYLHQVGGIFEYSYKENTYEIIGKKLADKTSVDVAEYWITSPRCVHPVPHRSSNKSMTHFADRVENKEDENENAYPLVQKDQYEEELHTQFPEQSRKKIESPSASEKVEAIFWVRKFSEEFQFNQLFPGTLISLKGSKKVDGQWCDHSIFKDKEFRIRSTKIKGEKLMSSQSVSIDLLSFSLIIKVEVEDKEETYIPRPHYNLPKYPFYILGTIFSEVGEDEQTTFNVTKNETTPLGRYQVRVPLSGEEEKYVTVPFTPDHMTGQHYFPLCQNQEVMLRMEFSTATIHRIINWQPFAELPQGTQGCQTVWASNGPNQFTFQKHEFEEGKNSVFTIMQSSSEGQTQTITIKEKEITVTVDEKEKQSTLIQLNRDSGLLIQLKDEEGGVTHSTLYENASITHTSKGSNGTSTIIQNPDSVEFKANKVTVSCEDFEVDASKAGTIKAASKIILDTPLIKATQEMTVG